MNDPRPRCRERLGGALPGVGWREHLRRRGDPGGDTHEAVHRGLVAGDAGEGLGELRRRRLQRRELRGELVERPDMRIALRLVASQGLVERGLAAEDLSNRGRDLLGAEIRVAYAEGRDEVDVVAGIADEDPAGTERPPKIVRDRRPDEPRLPRAERRRSAKAGARSTIAR